MVCFGCGMYAHREEACSLESNEASAAPENVEANGENIPTRDCMSHEMREDNLISLEIMELYGPWMLATRTTRKKILGHSHQQS